MGGLSSEREISLASGKAVANGLKVAGYQVLWIDLTTHDVEVPDDVDVAFIALHGAFGEDGSIQKILEKKKIHYTGSGPEASLQAFDKCLSKAVFVKHQISTPPYQILQADYPLNLALPVLIKPPLQGSSIGIEHVFKEEEWAPAFKRALKYNQPLLVERFIPGRELTVGIAGEQILPVLEIRAPKGNYNYHAKYSKGITEYLVPAPLPHELSKTCQDLAMKAFKTLGCSGVGRVDFRMNEEGTLFVLEVNTIPGFTETSLLPKSALAAGIPFPDLCEKILNAT